MTELHARGLERFHFWGDYSVTIILEFASEEEADRALPVLNQVKHPSKRRNACGNTCAPGEWSKAKKSPHVLLAWIADPDLKAVHEQLAGYGADMKKISSCARSIDSGEVFTITVPAPAPEDPNQLQLL